MERIVFFHLGLCILAWCTYIKCHEIILERIEAAFGTDDQLFNFDNLRVKKFNRTTFVISGKYILKQQLDDTMSMEVAGFNFQAGQYKKIIDKKFDKYCETMYQDAFKFYYEQFQAATDHPTPWKACPFPPGKNEVHNFLIEDIGLLPPYIPGSDKWRADIRFFKNDKLVGGYNVYGIIRNEEKILNMK